MSNNLKNQKFISVKKANLHNLKDVSVDIPHNSLTVITGVSGSGKSSLAFDTIYAEGQRRFVESLSSYARQFLERMNKPDVESISGLPPAIAIEQKPVSKNPRSTVGTTTEIYDYLRLFFGRIGTTICKSCNKPVRKDSSSSVVEFLLNNCENSKIYILFRFNLSLNEIKDEINKAMEYGFSRVVLDDIDELHDINSIEIKRKYLTDELAVLVDRLKVTKEKDNISRLTDSIETAFRAGNGKIEIKDFFSNKIYKFSNLYECADCDIVYVEPEPRLFSFNNPFGACPHCQGFGRTIGLDEDLIIPDRTKTLRTGVIHPFRTNKHSKNLRDLINISLKFNIPLDIPYQSLTDEQIDIVWNGAGDYIGINEFFKIIEEESYKLHYRVLMSRYRGYTKCKACNGSRLRTSARQVFIQGKTIPNLVNMSLGELYEWIKNINLNDFQLNIISQVLKEITWRIGLLVEIGLEYLTLDRLTHTLSGGEAQRINLSTALGSSLVGTLYVLDEPSIGMHARDTKRLLNILFKLRNLGNTIIVVEHDPEIIKEANYIIDLGPKAGNNGGKLIFSGDYNAMLKSKDSLTGNYLNGKLNVNTDNIRVKGNGRKLIIHNPRKHNLKIKKIEFPLACMIAVTGVSGSGKSTLIHEILYKGLKKTHELGEENSGAYDRIEGTSWIDNVELVDQSPIGRSSRSTPVTFSKAFDFIRELFADTQAARQLGFRSGHFSFNVPGGRCEACEGEGSVTVEMQFLPDIHLECESCKGTRYKKETRGILFKGKSIVDVLNMTIDESIEFFKDEKKIIKKLKYLQEVGLGYLQLGQPSTMLSGGEAQRVKLAAHLEISKPGNDNIYIFDEPTTGLHLDDISKLLKCFKALVEKGNTLVIIEHNLHVISASDWIIDMGPEAGNKGGKIVACGTPEQIMQIENSYTGIALKEFYKDFGK